MGGRNIEGSTTTNLLLVDRGDGEIYRRLINRNLPSERQFGTSSYAHVNDLFFKPAMTRNNCNGIFLGITFALFFQANKLNSWRLGGKEKQRPRVSSGKANGRSFRFLNNETGRSAKFHPVPRFPRLEPTRGNSYKDIR